MQKQVIAKAGETSGYRTALFGVVPKMYEALFDLNKNLRGVATTPLVRRGLKGHSVILKSKQIALLMTNPACEDLQKTMYQTTFFERKKSEFDSLLLFMDFGLKKLSVAEF